MDRYTQIGALLTASIILLTMTGLGQLGFEVGEAFFLATLGWVVLGATLSAIFNRWPIGGR